MAAYLSGLDSRTTEVVQTLTNTLIACRLPSCRESTDRNFSLDRNLRASRLPSALLWILAYSGVLSNCKP
jgi:hypothetical protein